MEKRFKRRLFVGAGLIAIAIGGWWAWSAFRLQHMVVERPEVAEPFVRLAGHGAAAGNRLLRERATYFDPTPLFLPTSQNFGQGGLPGRLRPQPGQVFANFPEKLNFADRGLPSYAAETGAVPDHLAEVLARASEAPFAGFGEAGGGLRHDTPRVPMLEVKSLAGEELIQETLAGVTLPRAEFSPLEFVVAVSPSGTVGAPVLVSSSGWEEIDAFFRDYLEKTYRIGARVAPGRYRVLVGP